MCHRHGGGWERQATLCDLNLLVKLMVLLHQILFSLAITAIAEALLMLQLTKYPFAIIHRLPEQYSKPNQT